MESEKKTVNLPPLNLPKTSFPMKGNLQTSEPKWLKFWEEKHIYEKMIQNNQDQETFSFIDGPPYANENLHIGHALNKILKDIMVKFAGMDQKLCPFVPIWDCHGLPIELTALKKISFTERKTMTPKQLRQSCKKEALFWVNRQKKQFKRLGVLADWDNSILTLHSDYEALQVKALSKIVKKGLLYRGKKPVHWCPVHKTAVASSEVEYVRHLSPSIYVKFTALNLESINPSFNQFSFVIWTTTPWTLPANQAVAVHPGLEYIFCESKKGGIIIAEDLKEKFEETTKIPLNIKYSVKGSRLEHITLHHPFYDRKVPVVLSQHVEKGEGTGCVHIAPGHGEDDFRIGQKYNLKISVPVDEKGCFTSEADGFEGKKIFTANSLIIQTLKEKEKLILEKTITHNYPYNPRSRSPLIFRATQQWFIQYDNASHPIRKQALTELSQSIQFTPEWGKQRLKAMLENSPDWCISRQRRWGVPIVAFICRHCKTPLVDHKTMETIAELMEKTKLGIEYWFSRPEKDLIPKDLSCSQCGKNEFYKNPDIMDVWFDSGICHYILKHKFGNHYCPADVYLEGSDQHRGWFQTSLNSSIALTGKTPFKRLITHCFVNDQKGYKMSKSQGNVVSVEQTVNTHGAEILRLWVAAEDYSQDLQAGPDRFNRITESYRRYRNCFRFMLGNLHDFDQKKHLMDFKDMTITDQWILYQLSLLCKNCYDHYKKFTYHKIYQHLNVFFSTCLSSLYLDIIKDRLYTFRQHSKERCSAQNALYHLVDTLSSLMAPILSFLCEEVYHHLPHEKRESVLLTSFPKNLPEEWNRFSHLSLVDQILDLRKEVFPKIEDMRRQKKIGSGLEIDLHLLLSKKTYALLNPHINTLKEFLIVSRIVIREGQTFKCTLKKADGEKCSRCWHYDPKCKTFKEDQRLCPKCIKNLNLNNK